MTDLQALIPGVQQICREAAAAILQVYADAESWNRQDKADASPVTAADLAAHAVIRDGLEALTPGWPQLSEEAADIPWVERQSWTRYWLIDPLDGTREFLDRNDEFTVNIALIEAGQPLLGVILQPVTGCCWWGGSGLGAWKQEAEQPPQPLRVQALQPPRLRVLTSQRHGLERMSSLVDALQHQGLKVEAQPLGSSLKFCYLAEGRADFYPRLGPTGEWDTAAAQAILEAAGGQLLTWSLEPLRYNQKASLINPDFVALADSTQPWSDWLAAFQPRNTEDSLP